MSGMPCASRRGPLSSETTQPLINHVQWWHPLVGIELGRTHRRWRVSNPALSIAGWVHNSTIAMFPKAPLVIPDGRISRVRLATIAIPWQSSQHWQGSSARPHTPCTPWFTPRLVEELPLSTLLRLSVRWWSLSPTAMTESPFASTPALPGGMRYYGLMRQTSILCAARGVLLSTVYAGCCEPLLHRGPSRRYLCASFLACLDPYPGGSCGA